MYEKSLYKLYRYENNTLNIQQQKNWGENVDCLSANYRFRFRTSTK